MEKQCINENCKEEFKELKERIEAVNAGFARECKEINQKLTQQEVAIVATQTDMKHVAESLKAVTKALWGVALSIFAALLGFFIWYVQTQH